MARHSAARRIVMGAFPDVQILDVTGPLEVFGCASRLLAARPGGADPAYEVEVVARRLSPTLPRHAAPMLREGSPMRIAIPPEMVEVVRAFGAAAHAAGPA
ncbi:MAG: hypothetical protein IT294_16190 [Deltaproteobacteria bacterium]|nr:hypothetical protein [Deltaproteobacteria bacterium]